VSLNCDTKHDGFSKSATFFAAQKSPSQTGGDDVTSTKPQS
jgi:hypothetical protein